MVKAKQKKQTEEGKEDVTSILPLSGEIKPGSTGGDRAVYNLFNKPHTISAMLAGGALVVYFAFTRDVHQPTGSNVKSGMLAAIGVFLLFSMLQMRDGIFKRPHPAVWRLVMGAGVVYLLGLVFLLFQSPADARKIMSYIDPSLGVPLPERSYAEHCELYTPDDPHSSFKNLWDVINDEFIWAHFIGWWGKTLLLRDVTLCWTLSILFEIWEMTFEYLLPNFKECWWDHIILDIIVCNGLGIYLGMLTCRALHMQVYDWTGLVGSPTPPRAHGSRSSEQQQPLWKEALQQFVPASYERYHWQILKDWKRFCAVVIIILIFSVVELNAFFLKYLLWIPPPHMINIWRLLIWTGIALPGLREYYQFIIDPTNKRFGTMAWLCCAVVGTELLVEIKYGKGEFPNPMPNEVFYPWVIFIVLFVTSATIFFSTRKSSPSSSSSSSSKRKVK